MKPQTKFSEILPEVCVEHHWRQC